MEPDRERMLDLLVRWEEAKAQGQDPRPEEFCGDCAELCLAENERRFAGYDERLLRPTTVPRLASLAGRLLRA